MTVLAGVMTMTDAERLAILQAAVLKVHEAIPKRIHPEPAMTDHEFISEVLWALDRKEVIEAFTPAGSETRGRAPAGRS